MRTIALALIVFLVGSASPAPRDPWENWGLDEPDMVIQHFPLRFIQPVCIIFMRVPPPQPGYHIDACANVGPTTGPCRIIMPKATPTRQFYLKLLEHEKAHCRGWQHGDPQPEGTL